MASSESISADDKLDYKDDTKEVEEAPSNAASPDEENALKKTTSTALTPPEAEPPDGGGRAWLQVLGSFICFSNLWGFTFAFGSFQTYYEITYLPHETASVISWIGTISTFLLVLGGVISGPFFDLGYYRTMLFMGAAIETLSVFLMSLCDEYYQLLLTQGLLMGLGNGLLYVPGLALVGRSFKKHRSIAMAITTCGAPAGGVMYTLIFQQLIGHMSFGWTVRIMGFVMLGSYLISFPLLLFRADNVGNLAQPGTKRKLFDPGAFKDLPFCWYTFSNFFLFLGYMIPFVFIASFGQQALGLDRSSALYSIVIAQASSIVGRLIAGQAAAKVGVMTPWIICACTSGILSIAWAAVHDEAGYYVYAALYGCFSGALIPLPPSIFPVVCPDPKVLGARLGMAQGIGSIASLIGSPIAAALASINAENKPGGTNYLGLQLFTGLVMVFGSINLVGLWFLLVKRRNLGKWI